MPSNLSFGKSQQFQHCMHVNTVVITIQSVFRALTVHSPPPCPLSACPLFISSHLGYKNTFWVREFLHRHIIQMSNLEPGENANWSAQLWAGPFNHPFNQYYEVDKENDQSIELEIGNPNKQARCFALAQLQVQKLQSLTRRSSLIFYSATVPPGELLHKGAVTIAGVPGYCYNVLKSGNIYINSRVHLQQHAQHVNPCPPFSNFW